MKRRNFYWILSLLVAASFTSCDEDKGNDPDNPEPPVENPETPSEKEDSVENNILYVLNQGNFYNNIAGGLNAIDFKAGSVTKNVFLSANGRSLGDTPQCGVCYGSKAYIGTYSSNTIEIADKNTMKSVKQISLDKSTKGQQPRSMVAHNGKVYISMYDGYVARLDTATLTIDAAVKVGPNPEKICIYNNKIYVPNSDGMSGKQDEDGNYVYGETASVINIASFTVTETLTVPMNPAQFDANDTGLYLFANGNYSTLAGGVYRLNGSSFEKISDATMMEVGRKFVYIVNAPFYGDGTISYLAYNPDDNKVSELSLQKVDYPSGMSVDRLNGRLFISSYVMNGAWPSYDAPGYVNEYTVDEKTATCNFVKKYDIGAGPTCFFYNR